MRSTRLLPGGALSFLFVLAACLLAARGAFAQLDTVEIPIDDFLIAECMREPDDARDLCLAGLAARTRNPAACEAAPGGRCRDMVARMGVEECGQLYEGARRYSCELAVVADYPAPNACAAALDPNACVGAVAAARREPNLIAERIADEREMQTYMAVYVASARDLRGLDYIVDPFIHDMALTNAAMAIGYGQDQALGDEYCARLRGGYPPDHQDIDASAVRGMCQVVSTLSDSLLSRERSIELPTDGDAYQDAVLQALSELIPKIESGEVAMDEVLPYFGFENPDNLAEEPEIDAAYGRAPPVVPKGAVFDDGWYAGASSCNATIPPPYYIGIKPPDASCPEGWIRRGTGTNEATGERYRSCAYCGPEFESQLHRFNCCVRRD